MIRPSLKRTPETAPVKDGAGLPWGCSVIPLAPAIDGHPNLDPAAAEQVPRCIECYGYINAYCMFERKAWLCALCGTRNDLEARYGTSLLRAGLEEMQRGIVDLLEECVEVDDIYSEELKPEERPACIAVVDVSGSEEFVEIARSGILALIEALPPATLFGLIAVDSSVCVYDMRSEFPYSYVVPLSPEGEVGVRLNEVLPAECFLVQIADNKDNISAAVESLTATSSQPGSKTKPGLAFGACIDAVLEAFEENPCCSLRIVSVIGNMPSVGLGALTPPDDNIEPGHKAQTKSVKGSEYYTEIGQRVVALSACVDLFVIAETGYVGVDALAPMVECVGGSMTFYTGLGTSALPQDLFKKYSRPFATKGLLRLRCSTGFQVARAFGHLTSDEQYENLYHVACCHTESCFAVDFEFDNPSGVTANLDVHPTIQAAFSYTCVVPVGDMEKSYQVQRRLRIETHRSEIGRQAMELYSSVDANVVMAMLCHKIMKAQLDEGLAEARMLLQDWLVILTSRYNQNIMRRTVGTLDANFSKFPALHMVPKMVYGMLRSKLMDALYVSRDERAMVCHICSSMSPEAISLLLYPKLVSFSSLDTEDADEDAFILSHSAVDQNEPRIYLMDCLTELFLYYPRSAKAQLPFPPPVDSGVRKYIQNLKDQRPFAPHVYNCAEGDSSGLDFSARLWEDPQMNAPQNKEWAVAAAQGFDSFMRTLREEVKSFMETQ
eukprot:CAMPEP_0206221612 /NCGR_PEP_ID=MMETSP0047_2-20121206/5511_1 /ASSEMBLY_ACC=CAM_ASM_000192 /TAXON_ID=195065 /ORGANISM="Chroomonas mesostigmatica_cf, Strain CCMP1168" /LENGTH=720 /DNA_ID=CAMNT_0053644365 /DNA_START=125 /DNA_END=2287 /DNA_ORIENTATION=+